MDRDSLTVCLYDTPVLNISKSCLKKVDVDQIHQLSLTNFYLYLRRGVTISLGNVPFLFSLICVFNLILLFPENDYLNVYPLGWPSGVGGIGPLGLVGFWDFTEF